MQKKKKKIPYYPLKRDTHKVPVKFSCSHPPSARRKFTSNAYFFQGGTAVMLEKSILEKKCLVNNWVTSQTSLPGFAFLQAHCHLKLRRFSKWEREKILFLLQFLIFKIKRKKFRFFSVKKIFIRCDFSSRERRVQTIKSNGGRPFHQDYFESQIPKLLKWGTKKKKLKNERP